MIVVTSFLHGRTSKRISLLLSDLQPLECHVFCSQSEEMHSELIPMPSEEEGAGPGAPAGYSHYGEFQALLKKWTNREVSVIVASQKRAHGQYTLCIYRGVHTWGWVDNPQWALFCETIVIPISTFVLFY